MVCTQYAGAFIALMCLNIVTGRAYPSCPHPEVMLRVARRDPHLPKGLEAGIGDNMNTKQNFSMPGFGIETSVDIAHQHGRIK